MGRFLGTVAQGTGVWKCGLVTSASNISAASTTWAGVTGEVAQNYGYLTGGVGVAFTLTGTTSLGISFTISPLWAILGGTLICRWAVVYETSGDVLCYSLQDSAPDDTVVTTGNNLLIDSDGSPNPMGTFAG